MDISSKPQTHQEVKAQKQYIEDNLIGISFNFEGAKYKIESHFVQRFRDTALACVNISTGVSSPAFLAKDVLEILENNQYKNS